MLINPRLPLTLSSLAALLAAGLATAGLFDARLYAPMTPAHLIPGTMSQDAISLVVALALLALTPRLARNAPPRVWMLWLGLLGYLAYAYAIYVFETVINPLYLGYIATMSLALWAVIAFFARADRSALTATNPPRRLTAALFLLLIALFALLWLSILIPAMQARIPPEAATIFALDFTFVLPVLAIAALMLWRAQPWGDLLALPLLIKAGSVGISVLIGTILGPFWGLPIAFGEVATYAILGLLPLALTIPWWRAL